MDQMYLPVSVQAIIFCIVFMTQSADVMTMCPQGVICNSRMTYACIITVYIHTRKNVQRLCSVSQCGCVDTMYLPVSVQAIIFYIVFL